MPLTGIESASSSVVERGVAQGLIEHERVGDGVSRHARAAQRLHRARQRCARLGEARGAHVVEQQPEDPVGPPASRPSERLGVGVVGLEIERHRVEHRTAAAGSPCDERGHHVARLVHVALADPVTVLLGQERPETRRDAGALGLARQLGELRVAQARARQREPDAEPTRCERRERRFDGGVIHQLRPQRQGHVRKLAQLAERELGSVGAAAQDGAAHVCQGRAGV